MATVSAESAPVALGQRLLRGSTWALSARLCALAASLGATMLLTRMLPPAAVGAYFLALTLVGLAAICGQLGMGRAMVRLVAAARAMDRPQAARQAIWVGLATTLLAGGLITLALVDGPGRWLVRWLEGGDHLVPLLVPVAALALALALSDLSAEIARGCHDLRAASFLADQALHRIMLAILLALAWLGAVAMTLQQVLLLALVAAALVLALAIWVVHRWLAMLGRHGQPWPVRTVLAQGPPFALLRLNIWLMAGADLWLLGMYRPADEVALYGAASRIALLVGLPLVIANAALAPTVAELHSRGERARLEQVVRTAASGSAVLGLPLMAVLVAFGGDALGLLFGDFYADGHLILVTLALGHWLHVALGPCTVVLTMCGRQREVTLVSTVTALLAVSAFWLVAQPYGAAGVALVTAASLVAYNVTLAGLTRRRLGIVTWASASPARLRRFGHELARMIGTRR